MDRKCGECGAPGANRKTCPWNSKAINPKPENHYTQRAGGKTASRKLEVQAAQAAQAAQKPQAAQAAQKPQAGERKSNLQAICNGKFALNDDFSLKHISFGLDNELLYKGQPVEGGTGRVLGSGAYGTVKELILETIDGTHKCAIKYTSSRDPLDELMVFAKYPVALTCEGVADMIRTPQGRIIMSLADGDLMSYVYRRQSVSLQNAVEIAYHIGRQLLCLDGHGIKYYDLKPANCLFYCRKSGRVDIALADLGSIVPVHDDELKIDQLIATVPPPKYFKGIVPIGDDMPYLYTYQLLLMIQALNDWTVTTDHALPGIWNPDRQTYINNLLFTINKMKINLGKHIKKHNEESPIAEYLLTEVNKIRPVLTDEAISDLPPLITFIDNLRTHVQ